MPRDVLKILAALTPLYIVVATYEPPDFEVFLYPWLEHIRANGPIGAFAEPFANYTPPYLYLLALFSLLPLSGLIVLKLLAVACLGWLAFAVFQLVKTLGGDEPALAGVFALGLPSVVANGPLLGQCDALWVAPCLLALAAAVDRRFLAAAVWASVAFACKAQAALVAPVVLGLVIRHKEWRALPIPIFVYLVAILPAWLAGWPLRDLFAVYAKQAADYTYEGLAPNLWAFPFLQPVAGVGYILAALIAIGAVVVVARRALTNEQLLAAFLLCALTLPFVLPKMTTRMFFLAELLAFVLAYWQRGRSSIAMCVLTQLATTVSMFAYLRPMPGLRPVGAAFMSAAVTLAATRGSRAGSARRSKLLSHLAKT